MLNPKKTKFRRHHRGNRKGNASKGNTISFGEYALQATEAAWLTSRQIEAGRRTITRYTKRGGKLWIRVFPDRAITVRPAETRMGSGKGAPEYWIANIQPGRIVYEVNGIPEVLAQKAMSMAAYKMPMKTKIISKII
jgi:large subunit ribosomal protein L16